MQSSHFCLLTGIESAIRSLLLRIFFSNDSLRKNLPKWSRKGTRVLVSLALGYPYWTLDEHNISELFRWNLRVWKEISNEMFLPRTERSFLCWAKMWFPGQWVKKIFDRLISIPIPVNVLILDCPIDFPKHTAQQSNNITDGWFWNFIIYFACISLYFIFHEQ